MQLEIHGGRGTVYVHPVFKQQMNRQAKIFDNIKQNLSDMWECDLSVSCIFNQFFVCVSVGGVSGILQRQLPDVQRNAFQRW